MKTQKAYLFIGLISLSGLTASLLLIPTGTDAPLMYFYDKQYEKAYSQFHASYQKGNRSLQTVIPYVRILLELAEVDRAIEVMEDYVNLHPQSAESLQFLAKLYVDANKNFEYLRVLEQLYTLKPSVDVIREKERIYGYAEKQENEIKSLETIIDSYEGKREEFLELAYQYASKGDRAEALSTLTLFLSKFPLNTVEEQTVEFAIDLLAEQGHPQDAFDLATSYVSSRTQPHVVLGMVSALQGRQLFEFALELLDLQPLETRRRPEIIVKKVDLLLSSRRYYLAYDLMQTHLALGNLPKPLYKELLSLSIDYLDFSLMDIMAQSEMLDKVPHSLVIKLIEAAYQNDSSATIASLQGVFSSDYLALHPALAIALSFPEEPILAFDQLSDYERLLIARVAIAFGDKAKGEDIISHIQSFDGIPYPEVENAALLFIQHGKAAHGFALIQGVMASNIGIPYYDRAWFLLGTGVGKTAQVLEWLEKQSATDEDLLQQAFWVSFNQKQASLALHLSKVLYSVRPTMENKRLAGEALLLNGDAELALDVFQELLDQGQKVGELYIQALIVLASQNTMAVERLEQTVAYFNGRDLLNDQSWRDLGYLMIDKKRSDLAGPIFQRLAEERVFKDPDMQTLLGIWENKWAEQQVVWIQQKAMQASIQEKGEWLNYMVEADHSEMVIPLVNPEEWGIEDIADAYVGALVKEKQEQELDEVIAYLIPQESRLPRLKEFGTLTYAAGFKTSAAVVYNRVLTIDPRDPDALFTLGEIAYGEGRYSEALPLLCKVRERFLTNYYLGSIQTLRECKWRAREFYLESLRLFHHLEEATLHERSVKAQLLYRLRRFDQAIDSYEELLILDPDNAFLRADVANLYLDLGDFHQAGSVLFGSIKAEDEEGLLTLKLAKVRYWQERLYPLQALASSNNLLNTHPESAQVWSSRADLEYSLKKVRYALNSIRHACSLEPLNESLERIERDQRLDYRPLLGSSGEYRVTGELQTERLWNIYGVYALYPFTRLAFRWEADHILLEDFVNSKGVLKDVDTIRYRTQLAITHDFCNGSVLTGSIYLAPEIVGTGLLYLHRDLLGATLFALEYHQPNWDFTQTIIEYGSRDMIGLGRAQKVLPRFEVAFNASLNRYNLKGLEEAATSWALEGSAVYALTKGSLLSRFLGEEGVVSFNAYLDAEYSFYNRKRDDPFGVPFEPFPLVDREIYTGVIFAGKRFGRGLAVEGYGGYSWDRQIKGDMVPIYGATVDLGEKRGWHLRLLFSHTTSTEVSGGIVERYLADLHYRF